VKRLISFTDRVLGRERKNYPREVAVTAANEDTVRFLQTTSARHIAEIGIWKGFTSLEVARFLNHQGILDLFDYHDNVQLVREKLERQGFTNVRTFGCSYKLLDSYNWPLAKLIEQHTEPIYDYVFLDGAHTWAIDALTTFLADRLLKVGGYLDFDDYNWTLARSPSLNPKAFPLTAKLYPDEQIAAKQVAMVVDLIIRRDRRYREVVPSKIFQKIA
jgi:predicted O-methyltransferase YrrM